MKEIVKDQYQEIQVDTYEEIVQITKEYNKIFDLPRTSNFHNNRLVQPFYRGQSDSEWPIEPSLLHPDLSRKQRKNITIPKEGSLFSIIAYKQHYCSETRFIDFTTNPDIAIYFACNKDKGKDGAVFINCYEPHEAEWYSTIVMAEVEELYTAGKVNLQSFSEKLYDHYPEIQKNFHDIGELNMHIISFLDHGFMVLPDEKSIQNNLRMQRQQGCFYVCGVKFDHELRSQDRWLSKAGAQCFYPISAVVPNDLKRGRFLRKIIIPKEKKADILNCLFDKGITHDYLFPDSD